jgi:F-type H+-transporting ATPase subunit delta
MTDLVGAYAGAIVEIARGEDALEVVEDELLRIAREVRDERDLYRALTEQKLPLSRRLELVEEIFQTAHRATRSAVTLVIAANRTRDLERIATAVAERAAGERGHALAEVWVARPLSDEQRDRLQAALEDATGKTLDMKVFVDENVVGGVRAKIGDTVIDGSLGRRLQGLRTRVGGGS